MRLRRMNRCGSEKVLSIWWFGVLIFVGVGITMGVLIFKNADINVKSLEADILTDKIYSCLVNYGTIADELFLNNFDIYSFCSLNKAVFGEGSKFYFSVKIFDENGKEVKSINGGDNSLRKDCEISKVVKADKYPKCDKMEESAIYYVEGREKNGRIIILTASNQFGRRGI